MSHGLQLVLEVRRWSSFAELCRIFRDDLGFGQLLHFILQPLRSDGLRHRRVGDGLLIIFEAVRGVEVVVDLIHIDILGTVQRDVEQLVLFLRRSLLRECRNFGEPRVRLLQLVFADVVQDVRADCEFRYLRDFFVWNELLCAVSAQHLALAQVGVDGLESRVAQITMRCTHIVARLRCACVSDVLGDLLDSLGGLGLALVLGDRGVLLQSSFRPAVIRRVVQHLFYIHGDGT